MNDFERQSNFQASATNCYPNMGMGDNGQHHHMGGGGGGGGPDLPFYPCSIELPPKIQIANAPQLDPSKERSIFRCVLASL